MANPSPFEQPPPSQVPWRTSLFGYRSAFSEGIYHLRQYRLVYRAPQDLVIERETEQPRSRRPPSRALDTQPLWSPEHTIAAKRGNKTHSQSIRCLGWWGCPPHHTRSPKASPGHECALIDHYDTCSGDIARASGICVAQMKVPRQKNHRRCTRENANNVSTINCHTPQFPDTTRTPPHGIHINSLLFPELCTSRSE